MRAVSVGFILLKSHIEIIDGEHIPVFDEVELLEVSVCAIPSNRGALAREKVNKLAFVESKRDEKILAEIKTEFAQQGRDFDAEREEFCELLLTADLKGGEIPDREETDYAELIRR
jgi:hypothetical protein